MTCLEGARLGKLIGRERKGTDDVIVGPKIVKGSVFVAIYFYMGWGVAHKFAVGLDARAWR